MQRLQLLLIKLAEECNEVAKAALKAAQFGLSEKNPVRRSDSTNKELIHNEINDLWAIVAMLNHEFGFGYNPDKEHMVDKRARVNAYADISSRLGLLNSKECTWTDTAYNDGCSDGWQTTCGNVWVFINGDPKENNCRFCPYCGGKILVKDTAAA